MATGLPVIVTDIPSNREWVAERENGWLVECGSSDIAANMRATDMLAATMLRVAQLVPAEREAIAERNQRIVVERADWDKNFPRLLEMYERLI
jgi:glycosyltransferase involved in cell wall biosynthesis